MHGFVVLVELNWAKNMVQGDVQLSSDRQTVTGKFELVVRPKNAVDPVAQLAKDDFATGGLVHDKLCAAKFKKASFNTVARPTQFVGPSGKADDSRFGGVSMRHQAGACTTAMAEGYTQGLLCHQDARHLSSICTLPACPPHAVWVTCPAVKAATHMCCIVMARHQQH